MIKWGIIGLGNMAKNFANSIKEVSNAKINSIASLNKTKLEIFKRDLNISSNNSFNDYNDLIKSKNIDAVYIATLNNTHLNLIKKCSEFKKNILCEKPIALNFDETKLAADHIFKNKVMCFEGIAYRSHPQIKIIKQLIDQGEIGEIKEIKSSFGFKVKRLNPKSRIFSKELGGGSLLDLGCYPLSLLELFNKQNNNFEFMDVDGGFTKTGVDDFADASIKLNNSIICKIKVSFKENLDNKTYIKGDKGEMIIHNSWLPEKKSYIDILTKESAYKKFINSDISVYASQIQKVSECFKNKTLNDEFLIDIEKSIKIMNNLSNWKNFLERKYNG
jgi:predicted dehydrogenase|tara:strand:- start:19 stop:1014 length:996 start_codon:yes stop_codon:yes gene_type:complete